MKIPEKIMVTDQEIILSDLSDIQQEYFVKLSKFIKNKYLESGHSRYVVSVSGPSGSGKSVLAVILEELLKGEKEFSCFAIDLDSFHYSNAELTTMNILEAKGRHDTYDTGLLIELLESFKDDKETFFPLYSRVDHEPHRDETVVPSGNTLLILPGLWFQREDEEWEEVRRCIDYSISIGGDENKFKQNTISRHIKGGRTQDDAEKFYKNSDIKNLEEIVKKSVLSDMMLPYFGNIETPEDIKFLQNEESRTSIGSLLGSVRCQES